MVHEYIKVVAREVKVSCELQSRYNLKNLLCYKLLSFSDQFFPAFG